MVEVKKVKNMYDREALSQMTFAVKPVVSAKKKVNSNVSGLNLTHSGSLNVSALTIVYQHWMYQQSAQPNQARKKVQKFLFHSSLHW